MHHYSVFVCLYVTEEVDAHTKDAARQLVAEKYDKAQIDYSIEDVLLSDEEEGDGEPE
jgi:hypothetical protein